MKNITTVMRFIAVHLGQTTSVASEGGLFAGREEQARTWPRLAGWLAIPVLAIALASGVAPAQAGDTLTISSTFSMEWSYGTVGADLAQVYSNGHTHTWTLTLHDTTNSHDYFVNPFGVTNYVTEIHATSFEFEFSGPDAATLNAVVSNHIAGGDVLIYLANAYASGIGDDFAFAYVWPMGPEVEFFSGRDTLGYPTLFPTDADGYPVLEPEPFLMWSQHSEFSDNRPGNDGYIGSWDSLLTFKVIPEIPPLAITRSNNMVIVSWPSPSTGFTLQQNNQLNTTNWVTPMELVTDTGTNKFITVDPNISSRFYRLFKP